MPRTNWLLLARSPCSPCSCRRVRWPGTCCLWRTGWLWSPRRSAPRRSVGRASAGSSPIRRRRRRSRSAPPPGYDAPVRELPWYKSALTIPAEGGGEVDRVSVSVTVVPSAGLMRVEDGVWVTLPSESKKAYTKLTAGLTPRPARTLRAWARTRCRSPGRRGLLPACAPTPAQASDGSTPDRRPGRRRASGAHGGVAAQIRHRRRRRRQRRPRHPEQRDEPAASGRPRGRVLDDDLPEPPQDPRLQEGH